MQRNQNGDGVWGVKHFCGIFYTREESNGFCYGMVIEVKSAQMYWTESVLRRALNVLCICAWQLCSEMLQTTQTLSTIFHSLPSSSSRHLLLIMYFRVLYYIIIVQDSFSTLLFSSCTYLYFLWLFSLRFAWAFLFLAAVANRTPSMMQSN